MLFVFIVVLSIFFYVLVRFRKRKNISYTPKQIEGNSLLEIIWTLIPIILLIILAIPTISHTFYLAKEPTEKDFLFIKVTAYQYWWEFEYPNLGIKTAQELHIPVGKKVFLEFHGKDVLHSFWVPALGGKTDIIPGKVTKMWLDAKYPGEYYGKCAEFCGSGHSLMNFKVFAEKNFSSWVAKMKKPKKELSSPILAEGKTLFMQNCMSCHALENAPIKGPELNSFAFRKYIGGSILHNERNLKKWLKDPSVIKPGVKMPKIDYLSDRELDALIKYLERK